MDTHYPLHLLRRASSSMYRQRSASTTLQERAIPAAAERMDTTCDLRCQHHGLARIPILEAAGGQSPCSLLSYHVTCIRPNDNQDNSGASYPPAFPVLDDHACTHDWRGFACQSSIPYDFGHHIRSNFCKLRTLVSTRVFHLRGCRIRKMGASCHHEHMRLSRHQLPDDS